MKYLLVLILLSYLPKCWSRAIELTVEDYGWLTSFPALKDVLDFYVQGVENDLNEEQPIKDPSRVNYGTANSSVLASRGLGTDYVNDPKKYHVSLGFGAAYDGEKNVAIRDEISGAAGASSLTLGTRLDQIVTEPYLLGLETKRLMGYVNFGFFSHSEVIPTKEIDIAGDIFTKNFGLHLRYDLKDKSGGEWWGWGGIKIHTGYEYNFNRVDLKTELDEVIEVDTGGQGILSGRVTGSPVFEIETSTHSIPIEISSNVYFLKVLSVYGGLGMGLNFGQSKGEGKIESDINTLACTSGVCVGETVLPQLKARGNYDAEAQVRSFTFRSFVGVQIDLPLRLHAFAQANQMWGTEVIGYGAGLTYTY